MWGLEDLGGLYEGISGLFGKGADAVGGMFGGGSGADKGLGWLSLLGTGAGIGSQVYNGVQQRNAYNQMKGLADKPIDPYQFYQQMGAAERASLGRSIKADMAATGKPYDGGFGTGLTSEIMAGRDTDRFKSAIEAALGQRQMQLGAYGANGRLAQGYSGVGDAGALGQYMRWRSARDARNGGAAGNTQPGASIDWNNYNNYSNPYGSDPYGGSQYSPPSGGGATVGGGSQPSGQFTSDLYGQEGY